MRPLLRERFGTDGDLICNRSGQINPEPNDRFQGAKRRIWLRGCSTDAMLADTSNVWRGACLRLRGKRIGACGSTSRHL